MYKATVKPFGPYDVEPRNRIILQSVPPLKIQSVCVCCISVAGYVHSLKGRNTGINFEN